MIADPQLTLRQVTQVNEELCIKRVYCAIPELDWIQGGKTIDHWFVQPIADAERFDRLLLKTWVMNSRAGRVTRQNAE